MSSSPAPEGALTCLPPIVNKEYHEIIAVTQSLQQLWMTLSKSKLAKHAPNSQKYFSKPSQHPGNCFIQ
eukprot:2482710-Amphidinium_carterae.1